MPALPHLRLPRRHAQRGAVLITMAMMMMFLLGFIGIALDFGRLFVVRTELQTAVDSCALAAAQELDGQASSITRATSAGQTAGNLNRVNFQSASWAGQGHLAVGDVTFRDAAYAATTNPVTARYAQCQHVQPNTGMWLLHALGASSGNTAGFPSTQAVMASAVATRGSAQSSCPIPVALRPKVAGAGAPNYGYTPGEWITLLERQSNGPNGYIGWANLDGSNSASETVAELNGFCGVEVGDSLGTPGVQAAVADVWNYRFGIYRNNGDPAVNQPDLTGYAYTTTNWPSGANAYNGPTPPGAHATAQNFVTKRAAYANCANTGMQVRGGPNSCEGIINRRLNSFQRLIPAGAAATDGHRRWGTNRRVVVVPVTTAYPGSVQDYACMLMLQPLSIPMGDVQLEFIGNAAAPNSPCVTSGLPGGSAGPLVPVLVR